MPIRAWNFFAWLYYLSSCFRSKSSCHDKHFFWIKSTVTQIHLFVPKMRRALCALSLTHAHSQLGGRLIVGWYMQNTIANTTNTIHAQCSKMKSIVHIIILLLRHLKIHSRKWKRSQVRKGDGNAERERSFFLLDLVQLDVRTEEYKPFNAETKRREKTMFKS